jgi:hypothetical protein
MSYLSLSTAAPCVHLTFDLSQKAEKRCVHLTSRQCSMVLQTPWFLIDPCFSLQNILVSNSKPILRLLPGYSTLGSNEMDFFSMLACYTGVTVRPSTHSGFKLCENCGFLQCLDWQSVVARASWFVLWLQPLPMPQEPGLELQTVFYFSLFYLYVSLTLLASLSPFLDF